MPSSYIDTTDGDIIKRAEQEWINFSPQMLQYQSQADIDLRFYCGEQTIWNDYYGTMIPFNGRQFFFNKLRRIVDMPDGYQRENRKSSIAVPVENGDGTTTDQLTKCLLWNDQQENVLETISNAFLGALVTGMTLLQVWTDYREDPINGNIKVDVKGYNSFVIDPYFRKLDLSDCNSIRTRTYVTKQMAKSLCPEASEMINGLNADSIGDGKFQNTPEAMNMDIKKLLSYDEYYYRCFREQRIIVDPLTGKTIEWKGDDNQLKDYLTAFPDVDVIDQQIPTVKLAIIIQGKLAYHGPQPSGIDCYPFVPVVCYYNPDLPYFEWRIQGMVRGLRDAQFLYNRRKVIELDILESQVNSGWIAKEGSFIDPKSPYKTGQGQVLWLSKNAEMTDVQQIPPSRIDASQFQVSESMTKDMLDSSGVNEENVGVSGGDITGMQSMMRQGAGIRILRRVFDNLDLSQRILGKIRIQMMMNNFTPAKVERIVGERASDQFYNKDFGTYDVAIEDGFNTTTQRQMEFAQLLQLKQMGVPIPDSALIRAATIQNKDKLIELMEQEKQQAMQMQQQQAQLQMQEQQATIEMAQARAQYERSGAAERVSRISENYQLANERDAEAEKDREQAMYNKVKTIKEAQEIDIANIGSIVSILSLLENDSKNNNRPNSVNQNLQDNLSMLQNSGISG